MVGSQFDPTQDTTCTNPLSEKKAIQAFKLFIAATRGKISGQGNLAVQLIWS